MRMKAITILAAQAIILTNSFIPTSMYAETDSCYELNGELPGVKREDLKIEFTEPQTVIISGRVERNYSFSRPEAEAGEGKRLLKTCLEATREAARGE